MAIEPSSNEVIIAVIGLAGMLGTAVFSNWNKIFSKKELTVKTDGSYRPTDDFRTELRHYFNVSGTRATLENTQYQLMQNMKLALKEKHPEDAKEIDSIFEIINEEKLTLDEVIEKLMPVYQNHFSIKELQELNRFYSTEIMQNMQKKSKALTIEAGPLQVELFEKYHKRLNRRFEEQKVDLIES